MIDLKVVIKWGIVLLLIGSLWYALSQKDKTRYQGETLERTLSEE